MIGATLIHIELQNLLYILLVIHFYLYIQLSESGGWDTLTPKTSGENEQKHVYLCHILCYIYLNHTFWSFTIYDENTMKDA
jgi:uncharacterized membrane protein